MDPLVWGPTYWDFLHTVAANYPVSPTATDKKVHYRLLHNFYAFIPHPKIAAEFKLILDANPLTPYLDTRAKFELWVNHLHNTVNGMLGKKNVDFHAHKAAFLFKYEGHPNKVKRFLAKQKLFVSFLFFVLVVLTIVAFQRFEPKPTASPILQLLKR